jgi:hypothetical protein
MAALLPTLSSRPNPQVVYMSSAPLADSSQLHAVRQRGLTGESARLAFLEWSIDPEADDDSEPGSWALANPGLGVRISEEFVAAEREAMPLVEFRRERLGVPDEPLGSVPPPFGVGAWEACQDRSARLGGGLVFGVEVAADRGWASVAASDGRVVELVEHRQGTGWLPSRVRELCDRHGARGVVVDSGGPAGALVDELRAQVGDRLVEVPAKGVAAACGQLFDAVVAGDIACVPNADLDVAVAGASKRARGDAFVWDRRSSVVDVSPLGAVTLARWGAVGREEAAAEPFVVWG